MAQFTPEEIEILKNFISHPTENVFSILPKLQGIVGAAYARYSRAKGGFRETFLREFLKQGILDQNHAQELIERILIAYGDDSVGELEGAWLSLEEISNLATKEVEDRRIGGSPIEQSTRYAFYDQKEKEGKYRYLRVPEIMETELAGEFESTMDFIFDIYVRLIAPMQEYLKKLKPINEVSYDIRGNKQPVKLAELTDDNEIRAFQTTYNFDIRTKACDTLRVLLPACTRTNVGFFGNGRFYQYLLTKLYSSELKEFQKLGQDAHHALNSVIPVNVKRARRDEYLVETEKAIMQLTEKIIHLSPDGGDPFPAKKGGIEFLGSGDLETETLALMLYKYAEHPMRQLRKIVRENQFWKELIFKTYIGSRRNRRDRPGRALEAGYPIAFDCVADFGIYRDLHRERMKTQIRQFLTTRLGYVIPDEFEAIGAVEILIECYQRSAELYEKVRKLLGREVAQYVVLFGHKIRWYQGMNYREAVHELELRTTPQGHPSYRKVCQRMYELLRERDPFFSKTFGFVDMNDYYWSRAESEAKQRAREVTLNRKLASGS